MQIKLYQRLKTIEDKKKKWTKVSVKIIGKIKPNIIMFNVTWTSLKKHWAIQALIIVAIKIFFLDSVYHES